MLSIMSTTVPRCGYRGLDHFSMPSLFDHLVFSKNVFWSPPKSTRLLTKSIRCTHILGMRFIKVSFLEILKLQGSLTSGDPKWLLTSTKIKQIPQNMGHPRTEYEIHQCFCCFFQILRVHSFHILAPGNLKLKTYDFQQNAEIPLNVGLQDTEYDFHRCFSCWDIACTMFSHFNCMTLNLMTFNLHQNKKDHLSVNSEILNGFKTYRDQSPNMNHQHAKY